MIALYDALAARERILQRLHALDEYDRSSVGQMRRERMSRPTYCKGPVGFHVVTADNPMRTGRCMVCRAFIGYAIVEGHWRTVTRVEAFRWGMYGSRRR